MSRFSKVFIAALLAVTAQNSTQMAQEKMDYPETKRVEQIDTYFGTNVPDPFRWLEDDVRDSEDVRNWVEAQNKVTFEHLEELPFREQIEAATDETLGLRKVRHAIQSG